MGQATDRRAELVKALQSKHAEIDAYVNDPNAVTVNGANVELKSDDWVKIKKTRDEMGEIKEAIDLIDFGSQTKSYLQDPDAPSIAQQAQAFLASQSQQVKNEFKSLGEMFVDSPELKEMLDLKKYDSKPMELEGIFDIASGSYGQKDVFSGQTGGPIGPRQLGTIQFDPLLPRPHRVFRVRDLFPAVSTTASLIDYFRVLGFTNGAASSPTIGDSQNKAKSVKDRYAANGTADPTGGPTDVFGLKPQSRLAFDSQQAPVRTIAHWEAAHRNVLADMPQLRGTIDNELMYGLRLEEDRQILSGSGSNDELLGVLSNTNIQTYTQANTSGTPTEQLSDALRRAATKVAIANFEATGYVLHPNDWEKVELQKAAGDGQYMLTTNITVGAARQVWRQPVVETVAIPEKTFLTGAFGLGAQLYDREQANVRVAEQHADFFVRNAIVVLVEERLALAVKRPEAFVKGTFM